MKLDPVLLEILVCPDCKSPLTVSDDNNELACTGCDLIYPVRDDIPVMLVDEARRAEKPGARPSGAQPSGAQPSDARPSDAEPSDAEPAS